MKRIIHGTRRQAIISLGEIDRPAREAIPLLSQVISQGVFTEKIPAAMAIAHIGVATPEAIAVLRLAAKDSDKAVRQWARHALKALGAKSVPEE